MVTDAPSFAGGFVAPSNNTGGAIVSGSFAPGATNRTVLTMQSALMGGGSAGMATADK